MTQAKSLRIGGASGYWGDASLATSQLLRADDLDFIVYDYLAEITMAILGRMRAKDPNAGYASDFVTAAMAPNLGEIARQNVRIISNAGGVNPLACGAALRSLIADQGLDLSVAVVVGDDLLDQVKGLASQGHKEMFLGSEFPNTSKIGSVNAYLGAFPIAAALESGADIVITGRCVDSAVTLGACIHAFGWQPTDWNALAAGSLAGHIIECGTQATGGNFTDWQDVNSGFETIGYPIVEVAPSGQFFVSKPADTGGLVSVGTVCEQMVYEIGDPQNYVLPDVICDFSNVTIVQTALDVVSVNNAIGRPGPATYKVCLTWENGFRGGHLFGYYGIDAAAKGRAFADAVLARASDSLRAMNAAEFSETSVEILGAESQFGATARDIDPREVSVKIAVKHPDPRGVGVFLRDAAGLGLSAPPGLSGFAGARPKPSPVLALFSFLLPKDQVEITISDDAGTKSFAPSQSVGKCTAPVPHYIALPEKTKDMIEVNLIDIAFARSGDKGNLANVGVIARVPELLPHIWAALDEPFLRHVYGHFLQGRIDRFALPASYAMNIVLHNVLGGGGTSSLRNDPQGKGYSQVLLAQKIAVPIAVMEGLK